MTDPWEYYFIEGTEILKNNLGITNKEELEIKEREITLKKASYLGLFPIEGKFDAEHLKIIHYFMFGELYPFAGEYRKCTMAKTTEFMGPEEISPYIDERLETANKETANISSLEYLIFIISNLYYDLIYAHPFREGNGRSIREFIREFVQAKTKDSPFEVQLDLSKMDKEESLKAVQLRYVYPSLLNDVFRKALVPVEKEKEDIKKL